MNELARRIAFTIGALLIFRLGTCIPVVAMWTPTGPLPASVFPRVSIFALGLLPYLTAAVVVRLVCMMFGSRERSGGAGRRVSAGYTLILTLALAAFQADGVAIGLQGIPDLVDSSDSFFRLTTVASMVGGVFFLIWLAEQITRYGIGNGLALVLTVSTLATLPPKIASILLMVREGAVSGDHALLHMLFWIGVVALMVFFEGARRNIRVDFAARDVGQRLLPARSSFLSIKLNSAGVLIPILVAPWFWSLPITLAAQNFGKQAPWLITLHNAVAFGKPAHLIIGSVVVFILALVYASRVLDPERTAESLGKLHGTIPGVDPGEPTADYLDRLLSPITLVGAVYIVAVSAISEVFAARGDALVSYEISGGSALVVVCTILDIQKQVRGLSRANLGGEHR